MDIEYNNFEQFIFSNYKMVINIIVSLTQRGCFYSVSMYYKTITNLTRVVHIYYLLWNKFSTYDSSELLALNG